MHMYIFLGDGLGMVNCLGRGESEIKTPTPAERRSLNAASHSATSTETNLVLPIIPPSHLFLP